MKLACEECRWERGGSTTFRERKTFARHNREVHEKTATAQETWVCGVCQIVLWAKEEDAKSTHKAERKHKEALRTGMYPCPVPDCKKFYRQAMDRNNHVNWDHGDWKAECSYSDIEQRGSRK